MKKMKDKVKFTYLHPGIYFHHIQSLAIKSPLLSFCLHKKRLCAWQSAEGLIFVIQRIKKIGIPFKIRRE